MTFFNYLVTLQLSISYKRIQSLSGSGSRLRFLAGSRFNEYGSETLSFRVADLYQDLKITMYLFRSCGVGTIPQFLQRQCPTRGSGSSSVTSAWTTFVLEQQQRRRTSLHQPGKIKLSCPTPSVLRSLSFFDRLRLQVLFCHRLRLLFI